MDNTLKVLREWNATYYPHSQSKCVHDIFEEQAGTTPDAIAVESEEGSLTFMELNQRSNQLARRLQKKGACPNQFVGISMERSLDMVVGIYGILKSGAAYVPLDPAYPQDRLSYMAEAANIRVLITQSHLASKFPNNLSMGTLCLDSDWPEIEKENYQNLDSIATPDDYIYLIFTSGSTGRPKGAAVYHRNFTNLISWYMTEFSITHSGRNILVSSLSFDLTQKNLYAPILCGGRLYLPPQTFYDPQSLSQQIYDHGITLINCTPSAFYPLIETLSPKNWNRLSPLRTVILGGEPISIPRLKPWFKDPVCRAEIANTYGPTECTDICGFYRMTKTDIDRYPFVPLGRPIHNVQLVIADDNLEPCAVNDPGELCVAGAGIGAGYINDSDLTSKKFVPNPFAGISGPKIYRTGDRARWLSDGVIEFLGRMDHQIKIRGMRVELHEIESILKALPTVREAVVVTREGTLGDEHTRLICYLLPSDKSKVDIKAIKNHLSTKLPTHMIPSDFFVLPVFPLSPNGKVDRVALQNASGTGLTSRRQTPNSSASNLERQIHEIWSTVLEIPQIDMEENFFDVGGNSLQLTQVHAKLQALVGCEFPITDLIMNPTIRSTAAFLVNDSKSNSSPNPIQERARRQREALAARKKSRY